MARFFELDNSGVTFTEKATYRVLYLNEPTTYRVLVFDKDVRSKSITSLLQTLKKDDPSLYKVLSGPKKSKLVLGDLERKQQQYTFTFRQDLAVQDFESRLRKINSAMAQRSSVVIEKKADEKRKRRGSLVLDGPPGRAGAAPPPGPQHRRSARAAGGER